jgi:hypothetical protein
MESGGEMRGPGQGRKGWGLLRGLQALPPPHAWVIGRPAAKSVRSRLWPSHLASLGTLLVCLTWTASAVAQAGQCIPSVGSYHG